jgi:hypothetical protein
MGNDFITEPQHHNTVPPPLPMKDLVLPLRSTKHHAITLENTAHSSYMFYKALTQVL